MMTATKTRKVLLRAECCRPPADITGDTKARRAWLAERVALITAQPNREAKIVGKGSYESISVYEIVQEDGRLRHRGHCQFCGNDQVADDIDTTLVLHGYKRPGIGYVFNECPGIRRLPLERDQSLTERELQIAKDNVQHWSEQEARAEESRTDAITALYSVAGGTNAEPDGYATQPRRPATSRRPTPAELAAIEQWEKAHAAWALQYPKTAAVEQARHDVSVAQQQRWAFQQQRDHFQLLLSKKYLGQPLIAEVVT